MSLDVCGFSQSMGKLEADAHNYHSIYIYVPGHHLIARVLGQCLPLGNMRTWYEQVVPVWQHHSLLNCCHAVQYCHPTPWPVGPYQDAIDLLLLNFADDCTHHAERAIDVD